MVSFEDIESGLLYFLSDKNVAIFPASEMTDWNSDKLQQLIGRQKVYLNVEYDGVSEKVRLLQVSKQSFDDLSDGQVHELTDTRNFVHELKLQRIHLNEILPFISPVRPAGRQKFPSLKTFFARSEDSVAEGDENVVEGKKLHMVPCSSMPPPLPSRKRQGNPSPERSLVGSDSEPPRHIPKRKLQASRTRLDEVVDDRSLGYDTGRIRPPPNKKMSGNHWEPMAASSPIRDARVYNQAPDADVSLRDLRTKLQSSFGYDLASTEGDIMLKLTLYRQNCKILSQQESLKNRMDRIEISQRQKPAISKKVDLGLPLMSLEMYKSFTKRLERESEYRASCIEHLGNLGGVSVKEAVQRCVDALMVNELQQQFNRTGKKRKEAFNTHMEPIIKKAVMPSMKVTERDVESCIQNYLRNSRDRLGGRRRRNSAPDRTHVMNSVPSSESESE